MRGAFRWERDTENFRRYVSEMKHNVPGGRDLDEKQYVVVYFPKSMPDLPKQIPDMIVSTSDHGIQCCELDNDWDGNCRIHSAPGVLRQTPEQRHAEKIMRFSERYGTPFRYDEGFLRSRFDLHGTETGRFSSRNLYSPESQRDAIMDLRARMDKTERKLDILFRAIEKILLKLRWIKPKPRKISIDIETTFDPVVITAADDKGHVLVIDAKK